MNNSNFGYDWRNSLDNCKFVPIFDEFKEIICINRYHNIFNQKVSEFVTGKLLKAHIEEKYNDKLSKFDKEDRFYEIKLQTKQKDCNNWKQQKNLSDKRKKLKKEQN